MDATLGKLVRLRKKLSAASAPLRAIFRVGQDQEEAVDKLTELQVLQALALRGGEGVGGWGGRGGERVGGEM